MRRECGECDGAGFLQRADTGKMENCPRCHGAGWIVTEKELEAKGQLNMIHG